MNLFLQFKKDTANLKYFISMNKSVCITTKAF